MPILTEIVVPVEGGSVLSVNEKNTPRTVNMEGVVFEPRPEDEGITCPHCDGPCGLDSTDEIRQEYLCLTCGARVRVKWEEVPDA